MLEEVERKIVYNSDNETQTHKNDGEHNYRNKEYPKY